MTNELVSYDFLGLKIIVNDNTIKLKLPDNLKVEIFGKIDFIIDGKFNIDASEVNLVSRGNPINIDSFNSKIFLNSLRCEQLKDDEEANNQLEQQLKNPHANNDQQYLPSLNNQFIIEKLVSLEERLLALEKRDSEIIDILDNIDNIKGMIDNASSD